MLRFPTKDDILEIHSNQIEKYGGSTGIRDMGLLESALAMPQAMFGGQYLHSSTYEMAAAYLFHIVSNHPFLDGNKRTGTLAALFFLNLNGLRFEGSGDALESLVISVAQGEADKSVIAMFFREHCVE
ncbi:MAG: type II toxin-antitoxin system death-on-curing family toxin [Planctomycetaceae bacterium]|jgi:death-on-curing protein|nr:type II toxin-antitoxin system death-on-curing family toxin [Planctomycetaceae bacterium]